MSSPPPAADSSALPALQGRSALAARPYPQLLRGAAHRWWRPLASLSVVLGGLVAVFVVAMVAFVVGVVLDPAVTASGLGTDQGTTRLLTSWWGLLLTNLLLAAGIPLAGLAVWAGHEWRPRWVSSVVGGLRWRWLAVAGAVSLGVTAAFTAALYALAPAPLDPEQQVVLLLLVVLATTPLQAAGEEYFFRGWLTQAVGSWFARPVLGALVAGAVSATLFAMAHGSQGPWLFADRFAFGVVASILVWRTGGLEASIAVHAVNNIVVFVPTILTGGLAGALEITDATWQQFAVDVVSLSVLLVVLDRLARRRGLRRTQEALAPPSRVPPGGAARPVQSALGTDGPLGW